MPCTLAISHVTAYNETAPGAADGTLTLSLTGVTGAESFAVRRRDGITPAPGAYGILPINLRFGWYTVWVTDDSGCVVSADFEIGVDGSPSCDLAHNTPTLTAATDTESSDGRLVAAFISSAFVADAPGDNIAALGSEVTGLFDGRAVGAVGITTHAPDIDMVLESNLSDTTLYQLLLTYALLAPGEHELIIMDAYGCQQTISFTIDAPVSITGAWAPVPYSHAPTETDGVTALSRLKTQVLPGDSPTLRAAIRGRSFGGGDVAFDVSGFLQGLFPRSVPFSSDDWAGADLIRYFRFNASADDDPAADTGLRAVLDSAMTKADLLLFAQGERLLTPFWRLIPVWPGQSVFTAQIIPADGALTVRAADGILFEDYGDPATGTGMYAGSPLLLMPCPQRPADIIFLGRCGGYGRYVFDGPHSDGVEQEGGETYRTASGRLTWANTGTASATLAVTADVPNATLADALAELRTSPCIWLNTGTSAEPVWESVVVTRESFTIRAAGDKRFAVAFTLTLADLLPIQGA